MQCRTAGLQFTPIKLPSDTILCGEKETISGHFYMDMLEGVGNDFTEVEQGRHSAAAKNSGGSNFTFVDGSARYLRFAPDAHAPKPLGRGGCLSQLNPLSNLPLRLTHRDFCAGGLRDWRG